jgi:hypothetical protein
MAPKIDTALLKTAQKDVARSAALSTSHPLDAENEGSLEVVPVPVPQPGQPGLHDTFAAITSSSCSS